MINKFNNDPFVRPHGTFDEDAAIDYLAKLLVEGFIEIKEREAKAKLPEPIEPTEAE